MDLLYMPLLDLQQHLKQELLNNPFLDLVEAEEEDEEEQTEGEREAVAKSPEEKERGDEIDWEEILLDGFDTAGGRREEYEEREYFEPVTVATRDLSDHLRDQVSLLELTPREMLLADEFIGNIGDDGYLASQGLEADDVVDQIEQVVASPTEGVTRAAEESGRDTEDLPLYTMEEAEKMLGIVQSLEPPGFAARTLQECLLLQLREAGLQQSLPYRLVHDCFDELIAHRWSEI